MYIYVYILLHIYTFIKYYKRGGAINGRDETVISKSKFLYNSAGTGGYSIFSTNNNMFDAGGNCIAVLGQNTYCQGIQTIQDCYPFVGGDSARCPVSIELADELNLAPGDYISSR